MLWQHKMTWKKAARIIKINFAHITTRISPVSTQVSTQMQAVSRFYSRPMVINVGYMLMPAGELLKNIHVQIPL